MSNNSVSGEGGPHPWGPHIRYPPPKREKSLQSVRSLSETQMGAGHVLQCAVAVPIFGITEAEQNVSLDPGPQLNKM